MAKNLQTKKINVNDFSSTAKDDMARLARSLNPFFDEVSKALSNTLSYEYITFEVIVDAFGVPTNQVILPLSQVNGFKGFIVTSATNTNGIFPTSAPFINFTINKNNAIITHIAGLPVSTKFIINVLAVS
jgi:hypothetical protein